MSSRSKSKTTKVPSSDGIRTKVSKATPSIKNGNNGANHLGTVTASSSNLNASSSNISNSSSNTTLLSSGYLLTCDPPTKQFILYLNETKIADKKFILEDLDSTHLLIRGDVREEIARKVEEWMDENVFSNIERVGENFDTS